MTPKRVVILRQVLPTWYLQGDFVSSLCNFLTTCATF